MKQPYIRDARLMLYSVLAELASIIAAHGSLGFFGFVVGPALAPVYAAVVALGIIGMAAGAGTSKGWPRAGFYAGMALFLVLETLANYFFAQEHFVARIAVAVAPGSDLAGTASDPFAGRALVVLYLSLASIAVAAFTHKAAHRFAEVRAGVAAEDGRANRAGQLRATVRKLIGELRKSRAHEVLQDQQLTQLSGQLAQACETSAHLQEELDEVYAKLEQAQTKNDLDALEIENLRASATQTEPAGDLDRWAIAQELRGRGVPLRRIAQLLGVSEGTVRNKTVAVTQNGHGEHVV